MPRMLGIILYLSMPIAGLMADVHTGMRGYAFWGHDAMEIVADVLIAIIAISFIPEAKSSGFRSVHWRSIRFVTLLYWLIPALAWRAGLIYLVALAWGMDSPGAVASGLLATDPAATSLSLGLSPNVTFLKPMFWQLGAESMLNDAIGISAFSVAVGHSLSSALAVVAETVVHAFALACLQTVGKWMLRRRQSSAWLEVYLLLLINIAYVGFAISEGLSPILLTALGSFLDDLLEDWIPDPAPEVAHEITHYWELLSQMFLAGILFTVMFIAPIRQVVDDVRVLLAGLSLVGTVIVARVTADFGGRAFILLVRKVLRRSNAETPLRWGFQYGREGGIVNTVGGFPVLGVPTVVALELAAMGHTFEANAIITAVVISSVTFIPFGFLTNQLVEEKYGNETEIETATWQMVRSWRTVPARIRTSAFGAFR